MEADPFESHQLARSLWNRTRGDAIEQSLAKQEVLTADGCPACGDISHRTLFRTTDRLFGTTEKLFEVVKCRQCKLMRLYPQPSASELRQYYPKDYWFGGGEDLASRAEDLYRRMVLRDHVGFVEKAIDATRAPGPVLDAGCGGGLFLRLLRERGHRVLGLDFSRDAAVVAWKRNKVPAVCGMLTSAPLPDSSISVLTMFHLLEHLTDPASYVESAHRLLQKDGRLIVQVPNAASWQFLLFGKHWNGLDVPRHLVNFRDSDVVSLVEACGFEVLRKKFFSLRDNPAGMATSMAVYLDPMGRRVRKHRESVAVALFKDVAYLALSAACLPLTMLEAACRAGSTVMIEARKKG